MSLRARRVNDEDHLMSADEFISACQSGSFIDYDGEAEYSNGHTVYMDKIIKPSAVVRGEFDRKYTHVVWYNR